MSIAIRSESFRPNGPIPMKYTGDGQDLSPSLSWANVPAGTKELAIICDDPDAPRAEPWVHWIAYKLPASISALPEGVARSEKLSEPAALQGKNSWGTIGYRGPAPPKGHGTHHYHFKLYALDAPLDAKPGLEKDALLAKMKGHVLAEGEVIGTYSR